MGSAMGLRDSGHAGDAGLAFVDQLLGCHISAQQGVILNQIAGTVDRRPVHHLRGERLITLYELFRGLMRYGSQQQ